MSNPQLRGVRAAIRVAVRATLTLSALVAVSAAVAQAQPVAKDPAGQPPAGGRGQGGGRGMQALFEGITLSETQQKSVDSLNAAFREKAQAAGQGADRRAMMEERTKAIKAILTPEQAKTYDANVEKMRANRPGGAL